MQYKIVHKGAFEKIDRFEKRLNELAQNGWRVVGALGGLYLIMGKEKY